MITLQKEITIPRIWLYEKYLRCLIHAHFIK